MNHHQDPELQAIAATLPLHIDFAWEDAASIEQAIQAITALADHLAANNAEDVTSYGGALATLHLYRIIDLSPPQLSYWSTNRGAADPRAHIFKGLYAAYLLHYIRVKLLAADPAQR